MKSTHAAALSLIVLVGLSCKFASFGSAESEPFSSASDKFSIDFPGGPGDVKSEETDGLTATGGGTTYQKSFDNRSDNYRSYEVSVYSVAGSADMEERDILLIGLNGWDTDPGTKVKDVTVNGQKGLDSVRTLELGPARMTFREVVFWNSKENKLYVVQIAASKEANVSTPESNAFVESFKITA